VSDADGPTKNLTSSKAELRSDSAALPSIDADATRNTLSTPIPGISPAESAAPEPKSIGTYRLVRKLGEGGMGQVWLAEQTAPVKRQVALKLIKGGMYDSAVIERFESERQSLAVMNHPAIAKVFDAGSTKDGQPYFVMEFVDGPPITRYCDIQKLKIRERLELFIKVCEGVQHAHQKAIIHRDLKPSNVLVSEVDGKPVPRIIDFGIAKAISSQPSAEQTMFTQAGALMGTPGFMSPEQADPSVLDVDTRTDVYSLGVLLYVLLTGMLPFDSEREKKKPIDELLRQLREEDPPSPSAKINAEKETGTAAAERRGTEAKQLTKVLRGDLDWITMKAVEKDRARRYGTPSELAADLERYLENRPVVARPASAAYRMEKYVGRHRVGVSAAAGLALLLAGFMVTQAVELRRIRQERDRATLERDRANRERDRATRITDFMTGMFQVSDPSQARGNNVTAREILDKASKQIDPGLSKDPELQAQMMFTMGNVYEKLGLTAPAQSLLTHSADIRSRVLGPEHPETLRSRNDLGVVLLDEGRFADAEKSYRETLEIRRRVLGPEHPDTLQSMNNLGIVLVTEGHFAEAEKLLRALLEIKTRVLGPEHPDTLNTMVNLAQPLYAQGRLAEAEKLYGQSLEIRRRTQGPDAPDTLASMSNLANVLDDEGHHTEAEKMMRDSLEIRTRVLGPEHRDTLMSMHNLGDILYEEGRYDEAEKVLRQTRDTSRRVLGPEYPDTAASTYSLGSIALRRGKREEALADLREAVDHGLPPMLDLGIENDPDLKALHGDPRFDALVAHAKARAAAVRKPK
jgi:serine/threonine protein kinase/Tfp pilus assembly protein PilF